MTTLQATTDLDTVRAFLNTLDLDRDADTLADAGGFAGWLTDHGFTAAAEVGDTDAATARELRDTLRALARANHDGVDDPDAMRHLSELASALRVQVRFTPAGEVELAGDGDGAAAALGAIVAATAAAVADGRWRRVKLCGSDDCAWAFYDASRNRSGRWCSMAVCGNREKARNFRSRQEGDTA